MPQPTAPQPTQPLAAGTLKLQAPQATQTPVQMTRAEYQAKFGSPPPVATSNAPVAMTHEQYMAKYGGQSAPSPGLMTQLGGIASNITDFLGLHNATNVVGDELAPFTLLADPSTSFKQKVDAAQQLHQTTPLEAAGAGAAIGATIAAPEAAPETAAAASGAGALLAGTQAGGSSLAQDDPLATTAVKTAVASSLGAVGARAIFGFGNLLGSAGDKITTSVIKPSRADIADGFSVDTINQFGLGGSLNQTYTKTQNMLNDLTSQLNEKLGSTETNVSLQDVLKQTSKDLSSQTGAFKNFGFNTKISGAMRQLQDEILSVGTKVSVPEAQLVKQSAGKLGAWTYGKPDPESSATEAVYNTFYRNLKNAIQDASPDGVKEINLKISKLIPVQTALIRRMPVAERNAALSLSDIITMSAGTLHPSAFGLTLLNRVLKSGQAGNALSNYVSGAVQKAAPITGEILGGATTGSLSSTPTQ